MKLDGRWVCFIIECNGTTGEFCSEAGSNFRPVAPFHLFPKPATPARRTVREMNNTTFADLYVAGADETVEERAPSSATKSSDAKKKSLSFHVA